MGSLSRDFLFAARMLGKNPAFTMVAIVTLALGIGANTTIFSVMNALVLRPLNLRDPGQLVVISETRLKQRGERTPTMGAFWEWKKNSRTLQDIALARFYGDPVTISGIGHAERVNSAICGINYFELLGVKAFRGRTFLPGDNPKGLGGSIVISERLWERTFGADPGILGQSVALRGEKKTIVGVLPPGFSVLPWQTGVDVWEAFNAEGMPQVRWLPKMGRLKPGVSIERAEAELNSIARGMGPNDADAEWSVRLKSLHETFVQGARRYFYILLGAVGFILLIACANVANLLLARGAGRQGEIAIRASLGAGRWRLFQQLLVESLLLGLLGGALGVLVGFWGTRLLVATAPIEELSTLATGVDLTVLGFTLGLSLLTGIVFGLMPAFRASRPDLHEALKAGGRQGGGASRQWGQGFLMVSEVALGVVLLVGAGLLINSFIRMQRVDLGFHPENVMRSDVFLDGPRFWHNTPGSAPGTMKTITPESDVFFRQALERIQALPGVVAAGISHLAPPGDVELRSFRVIGRPAPPAGQENHAGYDEISGGFFASLDIPLLKGRYVTDRDAEASPWVVDINQTLARRFFAHEDPIGKLVQSSIVAGAVGQLEEDRPREIVGVVGDVRQFGAGSEQDPIMYGSYLQHGKNFPGGLYVYHCWKSFTIRTSGNPLSLVTALQDAVAAIDKDQALFDTQTMEQGLAAWVAFPRFQMRLFAVFGAIGLVLAAVGIYGVMSYLVAQRTHEIGVRVAFGARPRDVLRLVISRGMKAAVIGLAIGVAGSLALTRIIAGFLFGVKSTDPVTYALVTLVLMAVALAACYLPARRATKVDPLVALRHE
jgi:putative ABC transport system permease protein